MAVNDPDGAVSWPAPWGAKTMDRKWYRNIRIVEADSVEDYLNRYYKKSRMTDTMLETYKAELERHGYVCTSQHDNVTGEFIAWPSMDAIERNES